MEKYQLLKAYVYIRENSCTLKKTAKTLWILKSKLFRVWMTVIMMLLVLKVAVHTCDILWRKNLAKTQSGLIEH